MQAFDSTLSKASQTRNQSMELFKLLASFLVVFIHCQFPGILVELITPIARIAVPGFFAISGFFSYQKRCQKIAGSILHILTLLLGAIFLLLLLDCVMIECFGMYAQDYSGSTVAYLRNMVPTAQEWVSWLFLHKSSFQEHLWYLPAILFCYCVFWGYVRFYGDGPIHYQSFYLACFVLYLFNVSNGTFSQLRSGGMGSFYGRTGLYTGLPMFALGLFLAQYREQIWRQYALTAKKLTVLTVLGLACSILERRYIGLNDLYLGSVIAVIALMLLMQRYPTLSESPAAARFFRCCGVLSTDIYIIHLSVKNILLYYFEDSLARAFPGYLWFLPFLVLAVSVLVSIAWELFLSLVRRLWRQLKLKML